MLLDEEDRPEPIRYDDFGQLLARFYVGSAVGLLVGALFAALVVFS